MIDTLAPSETANPLGPLSRKVFISSYHQLIELLSSELLNKASAFVEKFLHRVKTLKFNFALFFHWNV